MDTPDSEENAAEERTKIRSVSATIISQFLDELEKDETLSASAQKLRKLVLEDGSFAEQAVRVALFPEAS